MFDLRDEEYWSDPFRTKREVEDPLFARRESALIIGCPEQVILDRRDTLPAVVLRTGLERELLDTDLHEAGIVTAVDLDWGHVYWGAAFPPPSYLGEAKTSQPSATAFGSEVACIDVRECARVPWRPTELLVTLLLRGQVSNRAVVRLVSGGWVDPEVARFVRDRRGAEALVRWPPSDHQAYALDGPLADPPISASEGIELRAERVTVAARWWVPGARVRA
jgi:hypothetical protein